MLGGVNLHLETKCLQMSPHDLFIVSSNSMSYLLLTFSFLNNLLGLKLTVCWAILAQKKRSEENSSKFCSTFFKRRQEKVLKIGVYYICLYTML
jgi:hypothetical protein